MIKYSVVVPVYNTEKYLSQCIDSILEQNTPSAFEVILVDDGSSDGSAAICDRYAREHACVRVIHQENQGVSVARNRGIEAASGDYVLFLDGDDLWTPDLLSRLDGYVTDGPDVIEFGYQNMYADRDGEVTVPALTANGEPGKAYLARVFEQEAMPIASSCTGAYRVAFLKEKGITFPTGVRYGEDFDFRMQSLTAAASVRGIALPLYRYRIHGESTINTPSLEKVRDLFVTCAKIFRMHPCAVLAEYYCMSTLLLANLSREDAMQLKELLDANKDILNEVSGKKARFARMLYGALGWYGGAKLVQLMVRMKHLGKA